MINFGELLADLDHFNGYWYIRVPIRHLHALLQYMYISKSCFVHVLLVYTALVVCRHPD